MQKLRNYEITRLRNCKSKWWAFSVINGAIVIFILATERTAKFILKNSRKVTYLSIYLLISSLSRVSPIKESRVSLAH